MGANIDIYGIPKRLERYKQRIREDPDICEENKKAIFDFFDHCTATSLSQIRVLIYAMRLLPIAKWVAKPFKKTDKADIERLMAKIEGNGFAEGTKQFYRVAIKKFFKWLEGNDEQYPDKVRWIKASNKNLRRKLPEELLTVEEVRKLVEAAENPRDKAFIASLYESGCRIGEIAGLKRKHVAFDQHGAQIVVNGKTGMRRVRLVSAIHHLNNWMDHHPSKDPDAPLWPRITTAKRGQPMNHVNFHMQLVKIAARAGVTKPVNPHSFRHARATHLAKMGLNEAQLSAILGWVPDTDMAATYIHMSGKDTDSAILAAYGIVKPDNNGQTLQCQRCQEENIVSQRYCGKCGMPLTTYVAIELEEKRSEFERRIEPIMELLDDPEVKKFLVEKMATRH